MDSTTILGLLRHGLTALGAVLVTNGVIEEGMLQEAVGAIVTMASVGWFVWTKKKS